MNKTFLSFFILLLLPFVVNARLVKRPTSQKTIIADPKTPGDELIIQQYLNDTIGFILYEKVLIDSIRPKEGFTKWELNEVIQFYPVNSDVFESRYRNIWRVPKTEKKHLADTVLSKLDDFEAGFRIPGGLKSNNIRIAPINNIRYISALYDDEVRTIANPDDLMYFLDGIKNINNAYLWLSLVYNLDLGPRQTSYKMVEDGILFNKEYYDHNHFDDFSKTSIITYYLGFDGKLIKIKSIVTSEQIYSRTDITIHIRGFDKEYDFDDIEFLDKEYELYEEGFGIPKREIHDELVPIGNVKLTFTLEPDGTFTNIEINKDIEDRCEECEEMIIDHLKSYTSKVKGNRVYLELDLKFTL